MPPPSANVTPENRPARVANWVAGLFIATTFYSYGTALMDYLLVYPSRAIVGAGEFVAYHALLEDRIIPVSVVPFGVLTLLNVALLWRRPPAVPQALVWASLICLFLDWLSTAFVQIPLNLRLNAGKDPALIQRVMDTNWGRLVLESTQALLTLLLLIKLISVYDNQRMANGAARAGTR